MGRFPAISLRLDLGPGRRLGPGKIDLLAEIATKGSITAAARALGMTREEVGEILFHGVVYCGAQSATQAFRALDEFFGVE